MKTPRDLAAAASLAVWLASAGSAGAASFNESVNGDLSGDWLAPTVFALDAGSNPVQGTFGLSPVPDVADLDYLAVIVPSGYVLSRLVLNSLNPGGANSFLGVQSGPQITMPPTSHDPSPLLGWNHIYANQQGSNLLPVLGISGPLGAGSYTFWINETDTSAPWSYAFDFQVTAVPEPSTNAMLMLGLGIVVAALSRRRKKTA